MSLTISLAFSPGMPCCRVIFWRTLLPDGRLQLVVIEGLERDAALDQLVRQDLLHRLELVLVGGGKLDDFVLAFELDLGVRVLQVEARADFLEA